MARPAQAAGPVQIPLVTFYSPSLGDHFTTTQPAWTCLYYKTCSGSPILDYQAVGIQGHVYNPSNPQPAGTVPLYHWFNGSRGDNFLTSDPAWAGSIGDTRWAGGEYYLFRIEGYIPSASGSGRFPLKSYWNSTVSDNAALATWRTVIPSGYGYYRTEGYLLPPESSALQRCQTGAPPNHIDSPSWAARANFVDIWPAPADFLDGDAILFTAPADWYRIDYWGHQYPVRGYSWVLAPGGFPAPGEAKFALLAGVTKGRIFVSGRGWWEAGTWVRALGEQQDWAGLCMLYDATGVPPGDLQTVFNDDNISDNGGWANVTIRQWW